VTFRKKARQGHGYLIRFSDNDLFNTVKHIVKDLSERERSPIL